MGQAENAVWKKTILSLSKIPGLRIFRNNVGQGWVGKSITLNPGQVYRAQGGEKLIFAARPVAFGLFKGSADGIGWVPVIITPEMVGKKVALFLSVETKADGGRAMKEQKTWHENITKAGGISVVSSDPQAVAAAIVAKI